MTEAGHPWEWPTIAFETSMDRQIHALMAMPSTAP